MTMMPSVLTEELAAVLRTVALADLCEPSTIAKAHGHAVAEQLDQLHAAGLVMRQGARRIDRTRTTLYTISTTGRDRLQAYDAGFRHRITAGTAVPVMAAARTAHLTTRGLYTGAELQPYDGRPGAMDAFALPIRMGNRLHYRDGRVQQLYTVVGVDVGADRLTFGPVTMYHGSPDCAGFAHPVAGRTEIEA